MKNNYNYLLITFFTLVSYAARAQLTPVTFNYTGAVQSYTVPACVSSITVDVRGAAGGSVGPFVAPIDSTFQTCGGRVQATITVTPGQVLSINVGDTGRSGNATDTSKGGYNGGGFAKNYVGYAGGGGGGKSDISVGGVPLVVAGGGGGEGYDGACNPPSGYLHGGVGGGLTGGSSEPHCGSGTTPAGGGTQIAGGAGGTYGGYTAGTSGAAGVGGNGLQGLSGGGGGGYYGGGGGCWMGGGGGSSYTVTGATGVIHTQAYNCGQGQVSICPIPTAGIITGVTHVCPGDTGLLNVTGCTGGTWTSSSTGIATVDASGKVTGVSSGVTAISYTVSNACGTASTGVLITVDAESICNNLVHGYTLQATSLSIAPNPTNGIFTVNLLCRTWENVTFVVTNILGQKITQVGGFTNTPQDIKLDVPGGIYYLKAITPAGRWTDKITVVR